MAKQADERVYVPCVRTRPEPAGPVWSVSNGSSDESDCRSGRQKNPRATRHESVAGAIAPVVLGSAYRQANRRADVKPPWEACLRGRRGCRAADEGSVCGSSATAGLVRGRAGSVIVSRVAGWDRESRRRLETWRRRSRGAFAASQPLQFVCCSAVPVGRARLSSRGIWPRMAHLTRSCPSAPRTVGCRMILSYGRGVHPWAVASFESARVARLATVTASGRPHVVPVVFVVVKDLLWTAVDAKSKSTRQLARLANIRANPAVSVLVDHYGDDWSTLWWVRAEGPPRCWRPLAARPHWPSPRLLLSTRSTPSILRWDRSSASGWSDGAHGLPDELVPAAVQRPAETWAAHTLRGRRRNARVRLLVGQMASRAHISCPVRMSRALEARLAAGRYPPHTASAGARRRPSRGASPPVRTASGPPV